MVPIFFFGLSCGRRQVHVAWATWTVQDWYNLAPGPGELNSTRRARYQAVSTGPRARSCPACKPLVPVVQWDQRGLPLVPILPIVL